MALHFIQKVQSWVCCSRDRAVTRICAYLSWGNGWLQQFGFVDFAGSVVVHQAESFVGLQNVKKCLKSRRAERVNKSPSPFAANRSATILVSRKTPEDFACWEYGIHWHRRWAQSAHWFPPVFLDLESVASRTTEPGRGFGQCHGKKVIAEMAASDASDRDVGILFV